MSRLFLQNSSPEVREVVFKEKGSDDEIRANCAYLIWGDSGEGDKNILAFVLENGRVIPSCNVQTSFPRDLLEDEDLGQNEVVFFKFTLAFVFKGVKDETGCQIKTFDTTHQLETYLKMHGLPTSLLQKSFDETNIHNKEVRMCRLMSGDDITFDGKEVSLTLKREHFFESADNDVFDNHFEIKTLDKTYSGLRYNGVDYECQQVICGKNDIQGQILGFITGDGEIIDINNPLLDGIFLIEGDESKKFKAENLISPSEVESPYTDEDFDMIDGEDANDESTKEKHAFGRYILTLSYELSEKDNYSFPFIHTFTTHNDMEAYFWNDFFGNEKDYDKEVWQGFKQKRDEINKKLPDTVGYGYEAKFAPELTKDKIISYCMKNGSADLVSVLTGQNSLLYISQDVKNELKEYTEQQTQKARKQR